MTRTTNSKAQPRQPRIRGRADFKKRNRGRASPRELAGFQPINNVEYTAEYSNLVECEWHSGYYTRRV